LEENKSNIVLENKSNASEASYSLTKKLRLDGAVSCVEKRLCYIGLHIIRKFRFVRRRAKTVTGSLTAAVNRIIQRFKYMVKLFIVRNGMSFDFVRDMVHTIRRESAAAKKRGIISFIVYWAAVILAVIVKWLLKLVTSVNYIAPLAAAAAFIFIIDSAIDTTYALKVVYNGEEIGYIKDESVFEQAEKQMLGRIVFEDYIKPDDSVPEFTVASVNIEDLLNEDELTDELIRASGNELSEATGLYVDDEFLGAVEDRQQLLVLLNSLKDRYRTEPQTDEEDEQTERVDFIKDVEPRDGLYPVTSVMDISVMKEKLNQEREAQKIYTVVKGDAPILIAKKNGIPYSQLKALNPGIEEKLLIGQEVLVKKSVPMLEVKIIRIETEETQTNFKIEQIQDSSKYQGYVNVTQKGKKGTSLVTGEVTYIDGIEVDRTVLDTQVLTEPVNEKVVVGGKFPLQKLPSTANSTSSNFIWPTAAGYVSCGFYGYWGHTGMDIAHYTGTAVYASAAGIVTKAAYNTTGYGYHIIISHGGGVSTLYGHNSKLHVKVGQWVEQGQLIASMGSTGRSSGPHCHFEIRENGKYRNPANYIGTRCPY